MEVRILGDPAAEPTLTLDHEHFAYAGKFVMSTTGKAVAELDGEVVGAVAYNADRTDSTVWWCRYITVHSDYRGEGIGPRLLRIVSNQLLARDSIRMVKIAVNNPYAYEGSYKAGFGYQGEQTGIAELILARPPDESSAGYQDGLAVFKEREDLSRPEEKFLNELTQSPPPNPVSV